MNIILTFIWFIYLFYVLKNSLMMAQQNLYDDDNRYLKWINKNIKNIMFKYSLLELLSIILILFINNNVVNYISFFIIYSLLIIYQVGTNHNKIVKKPLVFTSRVKRLCLTLLIISILLTIICINIGINYLIVLSIISYLIYFLVLLVIKINIPVEKLVFIHYKNKALRKLSTIPNLDVVGITGSYGKTSSKNILNEIFNSKFITIPTPKNLNTPYGLIMTINNNLDKFDEIFIAEMGAYKPGEIKELCDLVHPKYGILTKIGKAHLELFKTQENIQKTKFELIESLPSDGVGILNRDDPLQVNYRLKNNVKILWIGIDNECDYRATNIKVNKDGTSFDLIYDNKKYNFETKLLGYSNIYNILSSIALSHYLGIDFNTLRSAVKSVSAVEHRLELKKNGSIYYIDDAYNSNPDGCAMALSVLGKMDGTKIVVTPGMIELGSIEYEENKIFGENIASVADYVMLIGKKQTEAIYEGLISKNYNKDKIYVLDEVTEAFALIQQLKGKETYVLLENDLPDLFK